MGADIYLISLYKTLDHTNLQPPSAFDGPADFINRIYDAQRATGGYFRNGYNSGDVMWAMGLSWDTVGAMLDAEGHLPIARAGELIEMIEARPLTRERVAAHIFQHMTDGVESHPLTGQMHQIMRTVAVDEVTGERLSPKAPPNLDELFGFHTRRDQLLAILRKSIELDEPLECSF